MKKILNAIKNEDIFLKNQAEIDEPTFFKWKATLEKELPDFWEQMR